MITNTLNTNNMDRMAQFFLLLGIFFTPLSTAGMIIGLLIATFCVLLSGNWHEKIIFIQKRPALWVPLLLFLLLLISTTHGIVPWHDRWYMLRKYTYLLIIPFLAWLFRGEIMQKKALLTFLAVILAIWVLTYLLFYCHISVIHNRNNTIFHDHISIGIFSAFSIFVFLVLSHNATSYKKYAYQIAALIGTWYILFINSGRSADVVFVCLLLLFGWQRSRWKGLFIGILINIFLVFISFSYSPVFHSITENAIHEQHHYLSHEKKGYGSTGQRRVSLKASTEILAQHPFIGTGTGSFFESAAKLPWMTPEINTQPVSNELLNISVQTGILAIFIIFLIYLVQWKESNDLPYPYQHIAQLLVGTFFFSGLVGTPLVDAVVAHFYASFIALCFARKGVLS